MKFKVHQCSRYYRKILYKRFLSETYYKTTNELQEAVTTKQDLGKKNQNDDVLYRLHFSTAYMLWLG